MNFDFSLKEPVTAPSQLGEIYAPITEAGPVFWNDMLQGWVVCGYDEAKSVLKRHRSFQNGRSPQRSAFGYEAMLFHDDLVHNRLRAVWANPMLPAAIRTHLDLLRRLAAGRQGPLMNALDSGEAVDLVPLFQDFTTDAITALMDVPDDRRDDFQRWNRVISGTAQLGLVEGDPRLAVRDAARQEVYAYLAAEVERHKLRLGAGEAPADFVSLMVAAEGQGELTAERVLDNLMNLFLGALDTTVRWMGNIVFVFLRYLEVLAEVVAEPQLLPQALEEILRYQSVVQVSTRHLETEDFELAGSNIRAGDMIYYLPGVAGWDSKVFSSPERFDIHRGQQPEKSHLGFGFGFHQCLGMHLARGEVLAFFEPLLSEMRQWRITEVDFGSSWSLWGPVTLRIARG